MPADRPETNARYPKDVTSPARQRPTATLPRRCGSPVTAMCNTLFQYVKSLPEVRCESRCNHFKPTGSGSSSTTPSLLTCCQSCGALFGMTTSNRPTILLLRTGRGIEEDDSPLQLMGTLNMLQT
ncbi:hypothetical protein pipiens_006397 [Culex pipiens pipiens]|uniref:Uncharacterized protein n=1 Tax=Culex pipiens pipiens TaxID=38569 RepID=A0ABD1DPS8_CULPP